MGCRKTRLTENGIPQVKKNQQVKEFIMEFRRNPDENSLFTEVFAAAADSPF